MKENIEELAQTAKRTEDKYDYDKLNEALDELKIIEQRIKDHSYSLKSLEA